MSKENNHLIKCLKSPEATENDIFNAFEEYFKTNFHFNFLKSHVNMIKKFKREYIYQFLFRKGFFYSLDVVLSNSNKYAIYSPVSFYLNPVSFMNSLLKEKDNSEELKELFSVYEPIMQLVKDPDSLNLSLHSISHLEEYTLLHQKFIILNCFRLPLIEDNRQFIFKQLQKYNLVDFSILLYNEGLRIGSHYVNSQLTNVSYFFPKHLNFDIFIKFLYSMNKLEYIDFFKLYDYLHLEEIQEYFKQTILKNNYTYLNTYRFHSFFEHKILNIEPFSNFDNFMISIFEIAKPIFINSILKKGELISFSYRQNFTPKQHFDTFKYKFKLFCESDFHPKIILHTTFFLNEKFKQKDKITHAQMQELIHIIFNNPRTLEKFKKNLKYMNQDFRAFFIIDDF